MVNAQAQLAANSVGYVTSGRTLLGQWPSSNRTLAMLIVHMEKLLMNHKRWAKFSLIAILLSAPVILLAVPFTFTAGQPIVASQINANFQALQDQIAAAGLVAPSDLVRVSAVPIAGGPAVAVMTIPSGATRPYVLRQAIIDKNVTVCRLSVGATLIPLATGSTSLMIPFAPGEAIDVQCTLESAIISLPWVFVFSR